MDIRSALALLRRNRWIIAEAVIVVAVVAGLFTALRTPSYEGEARVILRPDESATEVEAAYYYDADRFVELQSDIITSEAVARGATESLPGSDPRQLLDQVSVGQSGTTDILDITARAREPELAADIANSFARAYIENRRDSAVGDLQRVADRLGEQLGALQGQIAAYDRRIDDGASAGETTDLEVPTSPTTVGPTAPDLEAPGAPIDPSQPDPTSDEGLKAARYAAAVQYQELYGRQQDLLVELGLKRGGAELLSVAAAPTVPVGNGVLGNVLLGGVVGGFLGLGLALLRDQLDTRVRSREEIEAVTGLPVLAELPIDDRSRRHSTSIATVDDRTSALSEAVRSLRTGIRFLGIDEPVRRIVVTSAGPGEGKTLVAANLAAAYADSGLRTVLISADLRRPRLETLLGVPPGAPGLSDAVTDLPTLPSSPSGNGAAGGPTPELAAQIFFPQIVTTRVPNLLLMPAGTPPPNPSELLNSRRTGDLFELLANTVDVVIVDTPPIGPVTDAALLAARADGVLLVAALGETDRGAARRARQTLDVPGVRLLGVVVNKVSAKTTSYDSYYRPVDEAAHRPEVKRWVRGLRARTASKDRVPSRT